MNDQPAPESDLLLAGYLAAPEDRAGVQLSALFSLQAEPIIRRILQAKRPNEFEIEEVASAAREQLLRQLSLLRSGERAEPIRDFRAYAASVAYSAWAEFLRGRHPERAMLANRLRYLLENRTTQKGSRSGKMKRARSGAASRAGVDGPAGRHRSGTGCCSIPSPRRGKRSGKLIPPASFCPRCSPPSFAGSAARLSCAT